RVAGVADQYTLAAVAAVAHHFHMYLGDQRASGVKHLQLSDPGFFLHGFGHAVGAEDDDNVIGDFMQLVNEHRPAVAQVLYHKLVVHHFMTHVDRWTEHFQGAVDDFDSPVDAGTEAARIGQFDLHGKPRMLGREREDCRTLPQTAF